MKTPLALFAIAAALLATPRAFAQVTWWQMNGTGGLTLTFSLNESAARTFTGDYYYPGDERVAGFAGAIDNIRFKTATMDVTLPAATLWETNSAHEDFWNFASSGAGGSGGASLGNPSLFDHGVGVFTPQQAFFPMGPWGNGYYSLSDGTNSASGSFTSVQQVIPEPATYAAALGACALAFAGIVRRVGRSRVGRGAFGPGAAKRGDRAELRAI